MARRLPKKMWVVANFPYDFSDLYNFHLYIARPEDVYVADGRRGRVTIEWEPVKRKKKMLHGK